MGGRSREEGGGGGRGGGKSGARGGSSKGAVSNNIYPVHENMETGTGEWQAPWERPYAAPHPRQPLSLAPHIAGNFCLSVFREVLYVCSPKGNDIAPSPTTRLYLGIPGPLRP